MQCGTCHDVVVSHIAKGSSMSTYRTIVQVEESSNYLASQAALQVTITVMFSQTWHDAVNLRRQSPTNVTNNQSTEKRAHCGFRDLADHYPHRADGSSEHAQTIRVGNDMFIGAGGSSVEARPNTADSRPPSLLVKSHAYPLSVLLLTFHHDGFLQAELHPLGGLQSL
jgi:hypothetical protein